MKSLKMFGNTAVAFMLALGLVACGDDSSTGATEDDEVKSSSSVENSSSSEAADSFAVVKGEFEDSRDNKVYKTVKIGEQTWMAENLNYKTDSSYCYDKSSANCKKYGRLYTWNAAMSACPQGWHLPSKEEFKTLEATAGGFNVAGNVLKSAEGWNGTYNGDNFGFSALPGGLGYPTTERFIGIGTSAYFWSATESGYISNTPINLHLSFSYGHFYMENEYSKGTALSVRCVQD